MAPDMPVFVACPDNPGSKHRPSEAVLRISDTGLTLWLSYRHKGSGFWLLRKFRPFRGPWAVQLLLTIPFAPTIVFGRQDVRWVVEDGGGTCLRITPFVPSEFWVDISFRSEQDRESVAGLVEQYWKPGNTERGASGVRQFLRRWWQAVAIPALLAPFAFGPMAGDAGAWTGCGMFASYVVIVMVAELVSYLKDRPPQNRPGGAVVAPD
jgi:hypothetical protein